MIRLAGGFATHPGRVRTTNQDRVAIIDGLLYAVADGMGGHRGGETAAEMASVGLQTLSSHTEPNEASEKPSPIDSQTLLHAIRDINHSILERAYGDDDLYGMGTTLTGIALGNDGTDPMLFVYNLGDSRTYMLRNGDLTQITEDHSLVAEMIRKGQITVEEARTHRQRSVVTRALGVESDPDIDITEIIPIAGARYLMCSDGISGEVSDSQIGSVLRRIANPTDAANELVRLANEHGGRDNATVIVVDLYDDSGRDQAAIDASKSLPPLYSSSAIQDHAQTESPLSLDSEAVKTELTKPGKQTVAPQDNALTSPAFLPSPAGRARKPLPINLRVLMFLALLAGLAAVVIVVIKNAPASTSSDTTPIVATTDAPATSAAVSSSQLGPSPITGSITAENQTTTLATDYFATPTVKSSAKSRATSRKTAKR